MWRVLSVLLVCILIMVWGIAPVAAVGGTFFDDDDSIFEADIEWLAAADVTKGCNVK